MTTGESRTDGHTPGPWTANKTDPVGEWCIHAKGIPWQLAYLADSTKIDWPLEANARLIAAAPEMFAASESLIASLDPSRLNPEQFNAWCELRNALAKAEGTQP